MRKLCTRILADFKVDLKAHRLFWKLLLGLVLFRILIISQIGFIDDEAYHWTWAKNISYSYFDHPGMVAWMIWPFSKIFGDYAFAIRLPSLLMFLGIVWLVYRCGKEIFSEKVGRLACLLLFVIPLWGFASLGTLPDVPLAFFWLLAFYFFWQSVRDDGKAWSLKKSWLLIGLALGLGMNSKLSCCLIGLGMLLYLALTPRVRAHLISPWPYLGALVTFALMTPIFLWNSQHEWASFEYQFLRRHTEAQGADWNRWLQFWSYQWIFMSPGIYFAMLLAFFYALVRLREERWRLIFSVTAPSLILFYYQPLMSAYKPHWSGPAYLILLSGACAIILEGVRLGSLTILKPKSKILIGITSLFLIVLNSIYLPLLTPVIPKVYASFKDMDTWQPKWDFSNEFFGWLDLGQHVEGIINEHFLKTGEILLLGAQRYELISQLTWATKYKVWQLTDETDQFYFDQPPEEKKLLTGKTFLIVNNDKYERDPLEKTVFDTCEKSDFKYYRGPFLARTFFIYICRNFQGIK